eukprot:CAMPEP_0205938910 /NCGR_PEP_ID=MMETSP1325-20131115/48185_1 /ASSEMBLY_ACC=CAM_ASM_000708 /TAXON_ID=236786 /ORGANISM="Florenciella sp., Strain RCC1007" /LENGTH=101 /DNA_ID=CAMNT_0053309303 /DNA_START=30 /DNA_END=332 /DNA_ORIENTATION=-
MVRVRTARRLGAGPPPARRIQRILPFSEQFQRREEELADRAVRRRHEYNEEEHGEEHLEAALAVLLPKFELLIFRAARPLVVVSVRLAVAHIPAFCGLTHR